MQADPSAVALTPAANNTAIFAQPTELASERSFDNRTFGWLAAALAVSIVVAPGVYAASLRRAPAYGSASVSRRTTAFVAGLLGLLVLLPTLLAGTVANAVSDAPAGRARTTPRPPRRPARDRSR